MTKKYELQLDKSIELHGKKLYKIKALISFQYQDYKVNAGDEGGYIEKEDNLSQCDNALVYDNALVFGNAKVFDNAWVFGDTLVCDNAWVSGNAWA